MQLFLGLSCRAQALLQRLRIPLYSEIFLSSRSHLTNSIVPHITSQTPSISRRFQPPEVPVKERPPLRVCPTRAEKATAQNVPDATHAVLWPFPPLTSSQAFRGKSAEAHKNQPNFKRERKGTWRWRAPSSREFLPGRIVIGGYGDATCGVWPRRHRARNFPRSFLRTCVIAGARRE
ncbi:hypothetical protein VUR80DRAFT_5449 [Thermomyces stellatus]